jgi:large subunit ribosomal protein L35
MLWSRGRIGQWKRTARVFTGRDCQWQAMFALGRLRVIPLPLARANSTLGASSGVVSTSPLAPTSNTPDASESLSGAQPAPSSLPKHRTQGRRHPKYPAIRPSISLDRPREWNSPIPPGFIPAYDEAVAYVRADAAAVQAEADALRSNLEKGQIPIEGIEDAKRRLDTLEIMAQVNLPEVRWRAANGMGQCSWSHFSKRN